MADISIGSAAVNLDDSLTTITLINENGAADGDGTIDTVEVWGSADMADTEIGIFYSTGEDQFSTRDNETIGTVVHGSAQQFSVDLDVQTGDYIGIYWSSGNIERTASSGTGYWYKTGDNIPCTTTDFSHVSPRDISVGGSGETAGGWGHKFLGVSSPGKVNGVANASIAKVCGVAA